jgi:hypothetical protein
MKFSEDSLDSHAHGWHTTTHIHIKITIWNTNILWLHTPAIILITQPFQPKKCVSASSYTLHQKTWTNVSFPPSLLNLLPTLNFSSFGGRESELHKVFVGKNILMINIHLLFICLVQNVSLVYLIVGLKPELRLASVLSNLMIPSCLVMSDLRLSFREWYMRWDKIMQLIFRYLALLA